jgi:CSLREA domain-containing protein
MRLLKWLAALTGSVTRRRRKSLLRMPERLESRALLSSIVVTSTEDAPDFDPGDGLAQAASGETTLRAAIQTANATPGPDTIILPTGIFDLTVPGTDNDAAFGDLDITESVTIVGAGPDETVIDASQIDQAFHLLNGAVLELDSLSITTDGDSQPVLVEDGTFETQNVTVDDAEAEADAPETDGSRLPAIDWSAVTVSARQSEFLVALYQSRPAARDDFVLFDQRPIIVDQIARLDAMNSIEGYVIRPLNPEAAGESDPGSPQITPAITRPEVLAEQKADEAHDKETPGEKRQGVINSLFQNRSDGPASVRQVSGERIEKADAEDSREALPALLPLKKDGELQAVPNDPHEDRPAPPPLPEPKIVTGVSRRSTPASQALVAGAIMNVVRPTAWKRTLRRISNWSRLVV